MAEVLVLVEHADGALKKISAELITAARKLGEPSAVVVGKPGTAAPLIDGLKEAGAAKIYVAESDAAENYLITPFVDVLAALVESVASLDDSHELPAAPWFPPGARWSARRVFLHIVAETAQHAGHADIIRESFDGQKSMG